MSLSEIKVYNTLTRSMESFKPFNENLVRMYVCGPTVYDYSHIGHARTYVAFDAIRRYLELRGYMVLHVQNITDIDDKIIDKAKKEGKEWIEVAENYISDYLETLGRLGVRPHIHPRVSMHIDDIIGFIGKLVEKGYAYESGGSVYFDVDKFDDYGRLSGRKARELWRQEEERVGEKRHPYDFALWKKARPGEPWWDSPWGPGRPGWHIECSSMSTRYLGERIDIHGGGSDLIFPHHENERAQSEAMLGVRPWVKYWLHTGMVTVRGEKMSKSLGNITYLRELLKKYSPEIIRLWVLTAHYRSQLEFYEERLSELKPVVARVRSVHQDIERALRGTPDSYRLSEKDISFLREIEELHKNFHRSMSSDFNTSQAFSFYYAATRLYYRVLEESRTKAPLLLLYGFLREAGHVFGLYEPTSRVGGYDERASQLLDLLVDVRSELRKRRLYELSDRIRDSLARLGIILMDKGDKTTYMFREE